MSVDTAPLMSDPFSPDVTPFPLPVSQLLDLGNPGADVISSSNFDGGAGGKRVS
jgi:hypothetical protein